MLRRVYVGTQAESPIPLHPGGSAEVMGKVTSICMQYSARQTSMSPPARSETIMHHELGPQRSAYGTIAKA